jgi:low temperature requirement protein LtrA
VATGDGSHPVTTVELFFDLVFVFAVTQLSHLIISDLSLAGLGRAGFLLLAVWWAWIATTWMVNWFDPASAKVRGALVIVMLAGLLLSVSLPTAFSSGSWLFAGAYAVLHISRNSAGALLLSPAHGLRNLFQRLLAWSLATGALWLLGAGLHGDWRLLAWAPALALEFVAPLLGYWLPGRGRVGTTAYDIEGGHFAERCQGFIIIALGESIVVTGATAADAGLTATVVLCLAIAFIESAALWWLYFGAAAEHSRTAMMLSPDTGRLGRDAYTYLHLPIVAGIIMSAVGDDLLIAAPNQTLHGVGLAMVLGGPSLYLVGENLFRLRMTGTTNAKRFGAAGTLLALAFLGSHVSALVISATVAGLLTALAIWELRRPGEAPPLPERADAPVGATSL